MASRHEGSYLYQILQQSNNCTTQQNADQRLLKPASDREMTDWVPALASIEGPRYLAFVLALEADIASGRVKPGMRLLPQRDMAQRLELSVGTIAKAYAEAEQRGLISGEVGRGTFVQRRRLEPRGLGSSEATINLALNVPPYTGEDDVISSVLAEIVADGEMSNLLGYLPHQGLPRHREAMVTWLASLGVTADADHLFITHGGQHALSIALGMVAASDDTVLTESYTYSGMLALSAQCGYRLHGVATDASGLIPESLDRAFTETQARVLYCMPTRQTPTGTVMPPQRRQAIAAIVRKHAAFLLEDDAYGYLLSPSLPPVSQLIPERSFYIVSFAKCLAPGLRIAAMIAPEAFRDRSINAFACYRLDGRACHGRSCGAADSQWRSCTAGKAQTRKGRASRRHRAARIEGVVASRGGGAGFSYMASIAGRPHAGGPHCPGGPSRHHARAS